MAPQLFKDRFEAGRILAGQLPQFAHRDDVAVLALPRGGVPVAFEIARELRAPLDVFLVRKLGVPGREELAMGAIASGSVTVFNEDLIKRLSIPAGLIDAVVADERRELDRREQLYRGDRLPVAVNGRHVILVDDGLATGASMRAAVLALRKQKPASIVVAVPVASPHTCRELRTEVAQVVCSRMPMDFQAVGQAYENFEQLTDEEVVELLERAVQHLEPAH